MKSTFEPVIFTIEEDYEIPQMGRRRRITALLPHDYEESDKSYSVLYLHDGQNLFDENAPYGNWAIDKSLAALAEEGLNDLIIITIDHGGEERLSEYSPFDTKFGEGEGKLYLQFLFETLKPYVDKKFRVHTDAAHTGIGGSSMGGLISLYAGMAHPEVFGRMLIFSPSLWIAPPIYEVATQYKPEVHSKLYLYAGEKESKNHISNVKKLKSVFLKRRFYPFHMKFKLSVNPEGTHKESFWREEFPIAIKWLYY